MARQIVWVAPIAKLYLIVETQRYKTKVGEAPEHSDVQIFEIRNSHFSATIAAEDLHRAEEMLRYVLTRHGTSAMMEETVEIREITRPTILKFKLHSEKDK